MASGVKGNLKQQQSLRLYDTLEGTVRAFEPMVANQVKLYVCGPTVYDDAHLGHARCYMTWDVLYRYLTNLGYSVTYVRNITDVDDKIILRARRNHLLKQYLESKPTAEGKLLLADERYRAPESELTIQVKISSQE